MGYNTDFHGEINIQPPLPPERVQELNDFAEQRQCTKEDHNSSGDKPSLWCNIEVDDDGSSMRWNWSEKTYEFEHWIKYYIENFLKGHVCDGEIEAQGDESDDRWKIQVINNAVYILKGEIAYVNPKRL